MLRTILSEPSKVRPPDFSVSLSCRSGAARPAAATPEAVWDRVREGRALLVFDGSNEGRIHAPDPGNALHRFAEGLGIAPTSCVYITQDRRYLADYRAACAARGVEPMPVLTYDYFISNLFRAHEQDGPEAFEQRRAAFRARADARERRFINLNLTPRPSKMLFLLSLVRDELWGEGFISFSGFDKARHPRALKLKPLLAAMREMPGFEDLVEQLTPCFRRLATLGPVELGAVERLPGEPQAIRAPVLDTPMPQHDRSWFTVVTETEMTCARVTEKPFRALLNFHPIVMFGAHGALRLIEEFGFQTFHGYVDQSYDAEPDARRRFDRAYAEVRRLCALGEAELRRLELASAETLEFNAHWGLTRAPRIYREERNVRLVDDLIGLWRGLPGAAEARD